MSIYVFFLNPDEDQSGAVRDIDLNVLITTGPRFRGREVPALLVADTSMASEPFLIRVEQDLVLTGLGDSDTVIREGLCRVEIEDKDGAATIE